MSIELEPGSVLQFHGPFTQVVRETLSVKNTISSPIAFKVKTTAPKQYCVRPNSGRVEPGETIEVLVLLQPLKEEPPVDYKCRDKFLVQSVEISADKETLNLAELWSSVEKQDKKSISEKKIRCAYVSGADVGHSAAAASNGTNGTPSKYTSGVQNGSSPTTHEDDGHYDEATDNTPESNGPVSVIKNFASSTAAAIPVPVALGGSGLTSSSTPAAAPATSSDISKAVSEAQSSVGAAAATVSTLPTNVNQVDKASAQQTVDAADKLQSQLSVAQTKISELERHLRDKTNLLEAEQKNSASLRQRINVQKDSTDSGNVAVAQRTTQEGVPVQMVMAIALSAFLIAYVFF